MRMLPNEIERVAGGVRKRWEEAEKRPDFHTGKRDVFVLLKCVEDLLHGLAGAEKRQQAAIDERQRMHNNKLAVLENDLQQAIRRHFA